MKFEISEKIQMTPWKYAHILQFHSLFDLAKLSLAFVSSSVIIVFILLSIQRKMFTRLF